MNEVTSADRRRRHLDAGGFEPLSRSNARTPGASDSQRPRLLWLLTGPGILVIARREWTVQACFPMRRAAPLMALASFCRSSSLTFLAAFVVQEMSMRIGAVTHRGYGELFFQRFGPFWGWMSAADLILTKPDHAGHRDNRHPSRKWHFFGVPPLLAVGCAVALVALASSGARYWRWERMAMALALFNLLFVAVAVLSRPSPAKLADALLTWTPLPTGPFQGFLLILASNIGATVTPWMLSSSKAPQWTKG